MTEELLQKIEEAEKELSIKFPAAVRRFISSLKDWQHYFGGEQWYFDIFNDIKNRKKNNSIINDSLEFRDEWKLNGVVIAHNGVGDRMLMLPKKENYGMKLDDMLFVMWHEVAEIRILAPDIQHAEKHGIDDFILGNEYVYKLDDDENLVEGWELKRIYNPEEYIAHLSTLKNNDEEETSPPPEMDEETKRFNLLWDNFSKADDWIDEERTDKISEILQILNECAEDDHFAKRAHLFLNRIYMRGFGIPSNPSKAIFHVRKSIEYGNYNAMSDLSFYYLKGMGVQQDLQQALEWMEKANEEAEGAFDDKVELIKALISSNN